MEVTKQEANALMKELSEAVKTICKKHNLELSKSSAKFGDFFSYNIQAVKVKKGKGGVNLASPQAKLYEKYGYEKFDFSNGKTIKLKAKLGKKFKIVIFIKKMHHRPFESNKNISNSPIDLKIFE